MPQVNWGHHVVLTMQKEQAFWWPWITVPHIAPPTPDRFKEALEAMDNNNEVRRECASRFSNYVDVIKEAIREGYRDFSGWKEHKAAQQERGLMMERLLEGKLELCLAISLDCFLLPLLMAQGLTYNVLVVKRGVKSHKITVYAERETCCTLQLIWAVSFETKVVDLDSLEKVAGLAVAKAIGVRRERGLEELDCAGKQKEVVRLLMDKQDEEVVSRGGEGDGADRDDVEDQSGEVESENDNQMLGEFEAPSLVEQVGVEADQISKEGVVYY